MKNQQRIIKYLDFEIVQTLTENKIEGDYDLRTEVKEIKHSSHNSFAWQLKEKKFEMIEMGIEKAKYVIDRHLKAKINPFEELGFKFIE